MEVTPAKPKRASRAKKAAIPVESSVVSAFGGTTAAPIPTPTPTPAETATAPAIFVEEIEQTPLPVPKAATAKKTRKPPVVAAVTPDGIKGSLSNTDLRPLIAHLPIHMSDIDNEMFVKEQEVSSNSIQPIPYDPNDVYAHFNQATEDVPAVSTESQIKFNESVAAATRPSLPFHYSEKLMIRFQDANRDQDLPDSTDVACFHCCHPFRNKPCIIPTGIEEGIWQVYGNFCCPECAAAYLFAQPLDSNVRWERYALLNRLYSAYLNSDPLRGVRIAPPRTILRMFGGTLDIADFRSIVGDKKMRVDVMTPPMISIIQVMDTKPIDFYDTSIKNTFIPWEMDRMNRPGAQGLRLRRSKPIAEKEATLEWCMGIKT